MKTFSSQQGVIIVGVVFVLGMFAIGAVTLVASSITSGIVKNVNSSSGLKTQLSAESVLREGAYQIVNGVDPDMYSGSIPPINYVLSNSVTVQDIGYPNLLITGDSDNSRSYRKMIYAVSLFPESAVFDHAVYAQNNLDLGGNITINGSTFANGDIDISGNAEINGDAYSVGEISDESAVTGDATQGVEGVSPPEVDTSYFYDIANSDGTVFSSADADAYTDGEIVENKIVYIIIC